jgi:putative SOS response-associated peptidase YedK
MCGRYASSRKPDDLVEEFEIDKSEVKEPLPADYNVAPTKQVYAVVQRPVNPDDKAGPSERQLRTLRWGLVPFWAKDPSIGNKMINARMETVHEKPAYRRAFASRRCLLPADGYFEWYPTDQRTKAGRPVKQPFFIRPADGGVLAMAGLYEIWKDPTRADDVPQRFLRTCTVITTTAEDSVGHIHDRMPLMVEPARYAAWLDPAHGSVDELKKLLVPAAPGRLEAYPVSTRVNNVRNNDPDLVDALPAEPVPGSTA